MTDSIRLDIADDGTVMCEGKPFLWAAFFQKQVATTKPVQVLATQVPHPFAFKGAQYQAFDYLLQSPAGSCSAISAADFAAQYVAG